MRARGAQPRFDGVADAYRWAEYLALGPFLQRTRVHFVEKLQDCRQALVLGDGDGRFLEQLLRSNRAVRTTAVDTSRRMLMLLRRRCSPFGDRLQVLQRSAFDVDLNANTDLCISHFFLDCLSQNEVEMLVRRIARSCKPGTKWLVSDFQIPSNKWLGLAAKLYIRSLYAVFRVLTGLRVQSLPDHRDALGKSGFRRVAYHQLLGGLLFTELWELIE